MESQVKILAIDDDSISRKMIGRALADENFSLEYAVDGEEGFEKAVEIIPDIIILDVEMPGMNGYEVCELIRRADKIKDVSIVFLSSHSTLRERMQGYEAGGDDYLVKPFEKEDLVVKLRVLARYREEQNRLRSQYELAQKTAMIALTGSSELGIAMQFVERSYKFREHEDLAEALIDVCQQFQLNCVVMVIDDDDHIWKSSSDEALKPLEKEMIEMVDREQRFVDFGSRTIINFSNLSLLVRNMPLDDMDRYGRMKDLLPMLLAAVDSKLNVMKVEQGLASQGSELMHAFGQVRGRLYHLAKTLIGNQNDSEILLNTMVTELNTDLLRMGLDDDQEAYVLHCIDTAIEKAIKQLDSSGTMYYAFTDIFNNLKLLAEKQEQLQDTFSAMNDIGSSNEIVDDGSIEMF